MATIYTHRSENIFKTYLLMAVFCVVVCGIGYMATRYTGSPVAVWIAVALSMLMNGFSFWFSDRVVLATSGAKPAHQSHHRELIHTVENLSITAGLPMPRVYVIDDPAPNAFATGRDARHAAIAVTTGLLATLDRPELEGVIAHELSHIGNRDMQLMTVAVILVGCITLLGDMVSRMMIFGRDDDRQSGAASFLIFLLFSIIAQIGAVLLQLAISRRREYLADASAALLTRYPAGLAHALQKISRYQGDVAHANSATAYLYIANPFAGSRLGHLWSTHPPVEKRIQKLMEMAQ